MSILNEEFEVHETLNEKIWNLNTKKLRPEVKDRIVEIVAYFEKDLDVPIEIVDIQICGSNASYNYTDTSDLDVHVIANFSAVSRESELLGLVYNLDKSRFNKNHDISIHGIDVELYIQDVKSNAVSNGLYSVCDDTWIKEPKPMKSVTKHNTEKEVEAWTQHIAQAIAEQDYEKLVHLEDNLYLMRHNSIAVDGETGKGNQIFKDVRSKGLLQKLQDAINDALSHKLTLESVQNMSTGSIINEIKECD